MFRLFFLVILIVGGYLWWSELVPRQPTFAYVYIVGGYAKQFVGYNEGAIADYDKAIEIESDFAPAYLSRGEVKAELRDYRGAIEDFTRAIELSPSSRAYEGRGPC